MKCITFGDEWLTWFLGYNPADAIRKIKCPVMALNGNLDLQVLSKDNLPIIKNNLPHNKKNLIKEYDSLLNHLLEDLSSSNQFSRLTISPAHWLLFLFSNDAKLGRGVSGKDVVSVNGISCYFSEYQIIE